MLETGRFLPGVVESLVGQKEGAKVVVPVTFPEQIRDPKLAGLKCEFDIEVRRQEGRREKRTPMAHVGDRGLPDGSLFVCGCMCICVWLHGLTVLCIDVCVVSVLGVECEEACGAGAERRVCRLHQGGAHRRGHQEGGTNQFTQSVTQ